MFLDVYKEYGRNYRLHALFKTFGYDNMAREVLNDVPSLNEKYVLVLFLKHKDEYKHHTKKSTEIFFPSVQVLKGMVSGYKLGYMEALRQYAEGDFTDIADNAPKFYEEYLEEKRKKQLKQKDNQTDRKEER